MSLSIQLTAPKTRPDEVVERTAFPEKVTIWCAISSHGILGPYFYEENGSRVKVNGVRYVDLLENKLYPDLSQFSFNHPHLTTDWWFMQDGARPHIVRPAQDFLASKFAIRTIGQHLGTHWPARSPDLTPCDFFLWGWVKDQLYKRYPIADATQLTNHLPQGDCSWRRTI